MASKQSHWPHLQPGELTLLDYSTDDPRDVVTLSDKEALVLQLANQIQEQQLEKAMLEQGKSNDSTFPPFSLLYSCHSGWLHLLIPFY